MDIQRTKIELAKLILNLESEGLLEKIKNIILQETKPEEVSLSPQEKKEIEYGLQQLKNGERISLDEFLKRVS